MRLYEEIMAELGGEEIAFGGAKAVLLAGRGAYVENVKGIFALSENAVIVLACGGKVTVEGESLRVARYGGGDLLVRGNVLRISFEREEAR